MFCFFAACASFKKNTNFFFFVKMERQTKNGSNNHKRCPYTQRMRLSNFLWMEWENGCRNQFDKSFPHFIIRIVAYFSFLFSGRQQYFSRMSLTDRPSLRTHICKCCVWTRDERLVSTFFSCTYLHIFNPILERQLFGTPFDYSCTVIMAILFLFYK